MNYYKYLPLSAEDEQWGLSILNAGCTRIAAHQFYPYSEHPEHHYFNWASGRVLNEYQLIYITRGKGYFESRNIQYTTIEEGTLIILFPGEWHRFKPDEKVGWDEYWVGFSGGIAENLVKNNFFNCSNAVIQVGIKEKILGLFSEIIDNTKEEKTGYQPLVSGALLHLLGNIHAIVKQQQFTEENHVGVIIDKARMLLRQMIEEDVVMEDIAKQLNVSYSWLRKTFKSYTGIALGQYLIQLKIERAKILLSNSSKTIKEIAYDLQFVSCFYFSRLFKEKTGLSPEKFRNTTGLTTLHK